MNGGKMAAVKAKRIYEPFENSDGCRILVDRLWPRGIKKEEVKIDYWYKQIAPSNELRKWFHHQPEKFEDFRNKYLEELATDPEKTQLMEEICQLVMRETVTFLFSAKDSLHNNAIVLKEAIIKIIGNN